MYHSSMKTQTGAHNEATKNFKHKKGYIFAPINLFKKKPTVPTVYQLSTSGLR